MVTDFDNRNNKFYFIDYNTKLNYHLNKNNQLSFSTIFIDNQLNHLSENNQHTTNNILAIKNEGYALQWSRKWKYNTTQFSKLSFSKYHFNYNLIEKEDNKQVSDFDKRNIIYDTNFLTEFNIQTIKKNNFNFGYQYSFKDVSYAYLNTTNIALLLDFDKKILNNHALFANYSNNSNIINFNLGFRLNYYQEFDLYKFEPRLIINKNIKKNLIIQATFEVKNQAINQIDETILSDLSLENRLWRLSDNKKSPIINNNQFSLGILYKNNGWNGDIDFYNKKTRGLTALSLGFLNPDGKTFRIGKQNTKGIDIYLKKEYQRLNIWGSYSFTKVVSNYNGLNNNKDFIANTSITHVLNTSLAYKIKKIQIALGWKWHTGKPFTKSITTNDEIHFIGINTERLPNYHRLDFSTTYHFNLSKMLKGKIGISLRNVYNKRNHLSKEYYGFNNINDPIKVYNRYSIGFTPNFLFKVNW